MACDTTSASSVGLEYMLATGRSTTAFGNSAAKRASTTSPVIQPLRSHRWPATPRRRPRWAWSTCWPPAAALRHSATPRRKERAPPVLSFHLLGYRRPFRKAGVGIHRIVDRRHRSQVRIDGAQLLRLLLRKDEPRHQREGLRSGRWRRPGGGVF